VCVSVDLCVCDTVCVSVCMCVLLCMICVTCVCQFMCLLFIRFLLIPVPVQFADATTLIPSHDAI
jgi:hypothetical protein